MSLTISPFAFFTIFHRRYPELFQKEAMDGTESRYATFPCSGFFAGIRISLHKAFRKVQPDLVSVTTEPHSRITVVTGHKTVAGNAAPISAS